MFHAKGNEFLELLYWLAVQVLRDILARLLVWFSLVQQSEAPLLAARGFFLWGA
jgi:hypothetical protein